MNQKNFSISEIHWSHIFNEFLMSVTPRREENAVFLETGSNSVMLFSIALWMIFYPYPKGFQSSLTCFTA